ncbi:hypothetical protein JCGZ_26411 [Jatropha curcas]|uniref:Uncharacterized protein n=1 Tax=Jatropha curcas TaxID=180498 RepID=A0A067JRG1_JATCU|nr:auxin-responsive protein SAUR32 [Jatropha curcas]KDP22580.1 hypothetical protein JCGZ_26411 [Jatropha curcas]
MDTVKGNWKRNIFVNAWERCKSLGSGSPKSARNICSTLMKSRSWHCTNTKSLSGEDNDNKRKNKYQQVAPEGCFSVYVGPEKQRFVIKTEFANHPLFKSLLEDAEMEYGFNSEGPILLPCDVDLFYKVLAEMDSVEEISTAPTWSPLLLCSPSRCSINKRYRPVRHTQLLKLNRL